MCVPFRDLRDVDDGPEDASVSLYGTRSQLQIAGAAGAVDDHLVEVTRLAGLHHMLEYLVYARPVRQGRKVLHRRIDPALRRHSTKRPIQEDAAPLTVEQRQPVGRARGDCLQGHL